MTKQLESKVIVKTLAKTKGDLENFNVYITNVPVFYASVHQPKLKYQSQTEKEFSVTPFVSEKIKEQLDDEVMLNKQFAQVGVTKTTKPPKKIKYPLSTQVEEGKANYDLVKGLWGFSVSKNELSKAGNKMSVNVIDTDGNAFTEDVGNGSICTLKLFGYKNRDGQLVVTLDTLQVVEHVAYEGRTASSDSVEDEVLGSYKVKKVEPVEREQEASVAPKKPSPVPAKPEPEFDESEDLPF